MTNRVAFVCVFLSTTLVFGFFGNAASAQQQPSVITAFKSVLSSLTPPPRAPLVPPITLGCGLMNASATNSVDDLRDICTKGLTPGNIAIGVGVGGVPGAAAGAPISQAECWLMVARYQCVVDNVNNYCLQLEESLNWVPAKSPPSLPTFTICPIYSLGCPKAFMLIMPAGMCTSWF